MYTLKDLKIEIEKLLKTHPEYSNLPLVYASDDEGNSYQKVHNKPLAIEMENIKDYYLEPSTDYDLKTPNCICIN